MLKKIVLLIFIILFLNTIAFSNERIHNYNIEKNWNFKFMENTSNIGTNNSPYFVLMNNQNNIQHNKLKGLMAGLLAMGIIGAVMTGIGGVSFIVGIFGALITGIMSLFSFAVSSFSNVAVYPFLILLGVGFAVFALGLIFTLVGFISYGKLKKKLRLQNEIDYKNSSIKMYLSVDIL